MSRCSLVCDGGQRAGTDEAVVGRALGGIPVIASIAGLAVVALGVVLALLLRAQTIMGVVSAHSL